MVSTPLRLAFTHIPRRVWAGGYNYLANLFVCLDAHQKGQFTPIVFAGSAADKDDLAELAKLPSVEVVRSAAFDQTRSNLAAAVFMGLDRAAIEVFRRHRVDVVIETARFFGWRLPVPAIAWFPDFQHRRLPQLFSPAARWRRDLGFRAQIKAGRYIMLASESALADCRKFYPRMTNEVSVVRFATRPAAALLTANPADSLAIYRLPPRYFYLPNQFWRHKNHQVVVDALTILKKRGHNVVVAASGSPKDPRDADYFDHLMRQVKDRGLTANFRYLGMIPLDHVYALLRTSVALINPSRFEGWSTTVEEAKSFGAPLVLSDIEVHREQAGDTARYFVLDDPATLADQLWGALQTAEPPAARDLLLDLDQRVAIFAADFAHVVRRAVRSSLG